MSVSEVAQLKRQIELELEAMRRGMYGVAAGVARHQFIRARMDRMGACQDKLAQHIGESEADQFCCKAYISIMKDGD